MTGNNLAIHPEQQSIVAQEPVIKAVSNFEKDKSHKEFPEKDRQFVFDKGKTLPQKENIQNIELDSLVENINKFISSSRRELRFTTDKELGKTIVKVINTETDDVIRHIPSDELIALAKAFGHSVQAFDNMGKGLLIETEA